MHSCDAMAERVCFLASAPNILLTMQVGRASLVSNPARLSMWVGGSPSVGAAWARFADIWSVGGTLSGRSVSRPSSFELFRVCIAAHRVCVIFGRHLSNCFMCVCV